MEYLSLPVLQKALRDVCTQIVASEPLLTEIDSIIGDGDHGYGMRDGFTALGELLAKKEYTDAFELFRASGLELVKTMGGASGVIFGTLFTGGHDIVKDKSQLSADDLIGFFDMGARAIMKRGRSGPGDKTMLDALLPAVEAMKEQRGLSGDVRDIMRAAADGARAGMEATKQMLPRTGRSKNFREQALGHPDPGAVSVTIIFDTFSNSISNNL